MSLPVPHRRKSQLQRDSQIAPLLSPPPYLGNVLGVLAIFLTYARGDMPSSRHTAPSRRPERDQRPEGPEGPEGPDNSRTGEDGARGPTCTSPGARTLAGCVTKHCQTRRGSWVPEDGRQDLRPCALPILAEKRIALASAGSWHQPGWKHEGGTGGTLVGGAHRGQLRHRTGHCWTGAWVSWN
jgi:hypothetical protein